MVVDKGQIKIIPEMHKKTWRNWMEGISDWTGDFQAVVQLWWGHQIPAWRVEGEGIGEEIWVAAAENEEEAVRKAEEKVTKKIRKKVNWKY